MALVVRSKVKEACKGMRCSGDFYAAVDRKVGEILKEAARRAKENGRQTIRPTDI